MGIIDEIKKDARGNRTMIQSTEALKLQKILNRMFYLDKDTVNEPDFVRQVMTRGLGSQERSGLHASALIVEDSAFCLREQVLALMYKQKQGEQLSVGLMRIFEEGNAVHEKWQRLFIRAGYSGVNDLDVTQFNKKYRVSFTPDIICEIPEFYDGKMIGELKSVNMYTYDKTVVPKRHPSAWKQMQWYMYLTGIHKGFVLSENKNNQEFKVEVYDFDQEIVNPFIERCEEIKAAYKKVNKEHKLVARPKGKGYRNPDDKKCKTCAMRDVCWFKKGERL